MLLKRWPLFQGVTVAGPTIAQLNERVEELLKRVHELEKLFEAARVLVEFRAKTFEGQLADRVKSEEQLQRRVDELQQKVNDQAAKNAALEEKTRHLEKLSDRTWQVWLALLVAFLGLIVAYLKK
jgi:hypothetical protein